MGDLLCNIRRMDWIRLDLRLQLVIAFTNHEKKPGACTLPFQLLSAIFCFRLSVTAPQWNWFFNYCLIKAPPQSIDRLGPKTWPWYFQIFNSILCWLRKAKQTLCKQSELMNEHRIFFLLPRCAGCAAVYPINQNLFSINFFLLFSLIFLVDRICIFFNGEKTFFFVCCALFWVGRQWFFDLLLQFQSLAVGGVGKFERPMTLERVPFGATLSSTSMCGGTNEKCDGGKFSCSHNKIFRFRVSSRKNVCWPWITRWSYKK